MPALSSSCYIIHDVSSSLRKKNITHTFRALRAILQEQRRDCTWSKCTRNFAIRAQQCSRNRRTSSIPNVYICCDCGCLFISRIYAHSLVWCQPTYSLHQCHLCIINLVNELHEECTHGFGYDLGSKILLCTFCWCCSERVIDWDGFENWVDVVLGMQCLLYMINTRTLPSHHYWWKNLHPHISSLLIRIDWTHAVLAGIIHRFTTSTMEPVGVACVNKR